MSDHLVASTKASRRILGASSWVVGGHIVSQGLRLVSNLVMTRLLVPDMFGVMAVAQTIMVGVALFSDFGIRQSIIQHKRGIEPVFLNTAWSLQILRGLLLCLVVLAIAFSLHGLVQLGVITGKTTYAAPELPLVLAAISVTAIFAGLESTKLATANRNLYLSRLTAIELSSQVAGLLTMFAWAWLDRSIWALVAGNLTGSVVKLCLSHIAMPGAHNQLQWDRAVFRQLFHFGKWIFLSTLFGFLGGRGIQLIQGALVTADILAFISIAGIFAWALGDIVAQLSGKVVFSVFSEAARESSAKLASVVIRFQTRLVLFVVPLFLVLSLTAEWLIGMLYDDRYQMAGRFLSIMALNASVSVLSMFYHNACLASGDSRKHFQIAGFSMILRVAGVLSGFAFAGVEGLLFGVGIATMVLYCYVLLAARQRNWWHGYIELPVLLLVILFYVFTISK